eukprot:498842-Pleurochrysis_carterae.AAC.1
MRKRAALTCELERTSMRGALWCPLACTVALVCATATFRAYRQREHWTTGEQGTFRQNEG